MAIFQKMLYFIKNIAIINLRTNFDNCTQKVGEPLSKEKIAKNVFQNVGAIAKTSDFKNDVISVLWTLFDRQNVDDFYLEFDATPERGIYATLVNKITNERMSIKPDQAVLLAMAADMEMYTTEMVMKELSTPFNKENVTSTACSVPLLALPDQMLEKALDCAINEEDYETASAIRDEIERRKGKKSE